MVKFAGWQLANAAFFAGNVLAVQNIPRLDSSNQMLLPLNFLTPAPYAFAIWGVIYSSELFFVLWQLMQCPGRSSPSRQNLLQRLSPDFCAANACQIAWCFAFRPRLDSPGLLWISALCLAGIAYKLSQAHATLTKEELSWEELLLAYAPLTLHFGWTSAAALVNLNGYVSRCCLDLGLPVGIKVLSLLVSLLLAGKLGIGLTVRRRSSLYGLTVAWALVAVAIQTSTSDDFREEFPFGEDAVTILVNLEFLLGFAVIAVALIKGTKRYLS
ncbi:unnamed protein product [Effrenium voratum]|nr:unnamed protein product [Effrenium voratum]